MVKIEWPGGRNPYRVCIKAGIDSRFELYDGDNPLAYVTSLDLRRRHLDESQRAGRRMNCKPKTQPTLRGGVELGEIARIEIEIQKSIRRPLARNPVGELRRDRHLRPYVIGHVPAGDISSETLFAMTSEQLAVHIARHPTVIARRLDYHNENLFADKFDTNPRYHRPAGGLAVG